MKGEEPLAAPLHHGINVSDLLSSPTKWPIGSGLYLSDSIGERMTHTSQFSLAPLTVDATGELVGFIGHIMGLRFTFIAVSFTAFSEIRPSGMYRPGALSFRFPNLTNRIEFCWCDALAHGEIELTSAN